MQGFVPLSANASIDVAVPFIVLSLTGGFVILVAWAVYLILIIFSDSFDCLSFMCGGSKILAPANTLICNLAQLSRRSAFDSGCRSAVQQ